MYSVRLSAPKRRHSGPSCFPAERVRSGMVEPGEAPDLGAAAKTGRYGRERQGSGGFTLNLGWGQRDGGFCRDPDPGAIACVVSRDSFDRQGSAEIRDRHESRQGCLAPEGFETWPGKGAGVEPCRFIKDREANWLQVAKPKVRRPSLEAQWACGGSRERCVEPTSLSGFRSQRRGEPRTSPHAALN
jgi:hypothetical protein